MAFIQITTRDILSKCLSFFINARLPWWELALLCAGFTAALGAAAWSACSLFAALLLAVCSLPATFASALALVRAATLVGVRSSIYIDELVNAATCATGQAPVGAVVTLGPWSHLMWILLCVNAERHHSPLKLILQRGLRCAPRRGMAAAAAFGASFILPWLC